MPSIIFQDFVGYLQDKHKNYYEIPRLTWEVNQGEHWLLVGKNGSGKSALTATLTGQAKAKSGTRKSTIDYVETVSSYEQKKLINQELENDEPSLISTLLYPERVYPEKTTRFNETLCEELLTIFDFKPLLNRHFRDLSTGETRKFLLIKALSNCPHLLVLDEPFEGLDTESVSQLMPLLTALSTKISFVFVLNRLDNLPKFITHYAYINQGYLQHTLSKPTSEQLSDLLKLLHLEQTILKIPPKDSTQQQGLFTGNTLVKLTNVCVSYSGVAIFKNLHWLINKNEHWQLIGKNGSGKTCLLNLITGDNPQCYSNNIEVFGFKRGSGESIWEIKQYIGYISNALHMDYRVNTSAVNTIISGFYDSIGLYQSPTDSQKAIAIQWLTLMGLGNKCDTLFTQLSYGDQRMLLIARAIVKHPTLLILDEPCLGLDEANRHRVLLLIEKVCASHTSTVIYVNHHAKDKIKGINHTLKMEDFK